MPKKSYTQPLSPLPRFDRNFKSRLTEEAFELFEKQTNKRQFVIDLINQSALKRLEADQSKSIDAEVLNKVITTVADLIKNEVRNANEEQIQKVETLIKSVEIKHVNEEKKAKADDGLEFVRSALSGTSLLDD